MWLWLRVPQSSLPHTLIHDYMPSLIRTCRGYTANNNAGYSRVPYISLSQLETMAPTAQHNIYLNSLYFPYTPLPLFTGFAIASDTNNGNDVS